MLSKTYEVASTLPNRQDRKQISTIRHALDCGSTYMFENELEGLDNKKLLNVEDEKGNTLLHITCVSNVSVAFTRTLIDKRVQMFSKNEDGFSALDLAVYSNQTVK